MLQPITPDPARLKELPRRLAVIKPSIVRSCEESECKKYRFTLDRVWDAALRIAIFGMLNPSKANDKIDDPTVRKTIGFALLHGCGGVRIVNLSPWRATKPHVFLEAIRRGVDVTGGARGWEVLADLVDIRPTPLVFAAWGRHAGSHPWLETRAAQVSQLLTDAFDDVYCLGRNADSTPCHPLTLGYKTPLERFIL